MSLAFRVPLAVAGLIWTDAAVHAQPTELPPIFAPKLAPTSLIATSAKPEGKPPSRLSDRVRSLVNTASERVLAEAKAFATTTSITEPESRTDSSMMMASSGAVMLPRYVVKSIALRHEDVEQPDLPPLRPYIIEREGRPGMVTGYTFPVWRSHSGTKEMNLNLIDFAGRGVDHARDFGRAELEFKIRF